MNQSMKFFLPDRSIYISNFKNSLTCIECMYYRCIVLLLFEPVFLVSEFSFFIDLFYIFEPGKNIDRQVYICQMMCEIFSILLSLYIPPFVYSSSSLKKIIFSLIEHVVLLVQPIFPRYFVELFQFFTPPPLVTFSNFSDQMLAVWFCKCKKG